MSEPKIEGSSPYKDIDLPFSEDEKRVNHSPAQPAVVDNKVQPDAAINAAENKSEQAQIEVSCGQKTYEGTTIKARNPIIVTMLIMTVVTDALKDSADKTKEISKLEKRMWKHYSDGQSDNFKQGENCQKWTMSGKGVSMALSLAASYAGKGFFGTKLLTESNLKTASNITGTLGDSTFQQAQLNIQVEDAKFQHKVGHTSGDYQNQSQQLSSDNQMVDSAREKGVQLGRLMVQLITAQPA